MAPPWVPGTGLLSSSSVPGRFSGPPPALSRAKRRQRQKAQARETNPQFRPRELIPEHPPTGVQAPAPPNPLQEWLAWCPAPSTGGRSGQRLAESLRYHPGTRSLEVRFASSGKIYRYAGVSEARWQRLRDGKYGGTRPFLRGRRGVRV
jgi:hypothetical protein